MEKRLSPAVWNVCAVQLLLSVAMYLFYPVWLCKPVCQDEPVSFVVSTLPYVAGLYVLGPLNAYLVDNYRRRTVCQVGILILLLTVIALYYVACTWLTLGGIRLVQGVSFALIQMSLGSTILNDLTDSGLRTFADTLYGWFGRIGLFVGLAVGTVCSMYGGYRLFCLLSAILLALAFLLLLNIRLPFRAPVHEKKCSLDRFWLPQGKWIFLNIWMVATVFGIGLSRCLSVEMFLMVAVGGLLAWGVQAFAFRAADLRAEVVCGSITMGLACFLQNLNWQIGDDYLVYIFLGLGFGLSSSRLLLYFLKISGHCQRGTAQHSYLLGTETGICFGLITGGLWTESLSFAVVLSLVAVFLYVFVVHPNFVKYGDRGFPIRKL